MKKVRSTKSTNITYASWRALAEAVGIDHGQLYRTAHRAHDEPWPVAAKGPWRQRDVQRVVTWLERIKTRLAAKMVDDADPESTVGLRKSKLREEIAAMKLRNEAAQTELLKVQGKLVPIADVTHEWERIGQRIRNDLQNFGVSIVPDALTLGMPMGAAAEFQEKVQAKISSVLRVMSDAGRRDADESEEAPEADDTDAADEGENVQSRNRTEQEKPE